MNEKDFEYIMGSEVSGLNENNLLKPYAYLQLFSALAEKHLNKIDLNVDTTMKHNLAWVLMTMHFEIAKPVKGTMKMVATTWYSARKGPYFRRELVFRDGKGELLFHGSTFSVLLDLEKRSVYRKKELPFEINDPIEEFTIEASPAIKSDLTFQKVDARRVCNSHIDGLGHVNNTRYGEFAYDAFSDEERMNLNHIKRMDISFLSELRNKDHFSVWKAGDGSRILIKGHNDSKDAASFEMAFEFSH